MDQFPTDAAFDDGGISSNDRHSKHEWSGRGEYLDDRHASEVRGGVLLSGRVDGVVCAAYNRHVAAVELGVDLL